MDTANNILNIIVDCSGSMIESGKRLIARNAVRQIEQYIRLGYACAQIRLFAANEKFRKIDWDPDQEYPEDLWVCEGNLDLTRWATDVFELPGKFLLLSDCTMETKSKRLLTEWANKISADNIKIIKIGNDPMPKIASVQIFNTEDIFAALDHWAGE